MAHRPNAYGLTAEVNHKIKNKYNVEAEQKCLAWISEVRQLHFKFFFFKDVIR